MFGLLSMVLLCACESSTEPVLDSDVKNTAATATQLEYLQIKQQPAAIAQPFCEQSVCLDLQIETVKTQDQWLNQWIEEQQSKAIQSLIQLDQKMSLQQAIDAYVADSDRWRKQDPSHQAYALDLFTRVANQRKDFVLLKLQISSQQGDDQVKEQQYFFVADRQLQRNIKLLDIIAPTEQLSLNQLIQDAYQEWQRQQDVDLQKKLPEKLYWGQADWFFDQEGIGIHYRQGQILAGSKQLDIYLTQAQTQQVLKTEFYTSMFQ